MPLKELNVEDFQEWFEMLATRHPEAGQDSMYIEFKSKEGDEPSPFAKLLALCARKSVHLSVPIQTFVPVSL